ncbi:hypothetical protein XBKQ1_2600016 [Xenorhabdus bovienii str. kraussei Quebec]|uniref:Uncharacterized protein n=1 Tax=Xenorhabdus bovienii str. kraussei Quebec TaxID=1398203 RepID=A0A077PKP4_XENBV|nr:hypothetical protein XBKQ1_2600016 [Xenorhabdus bovienii str. kraussei Quebec]
MFGSKSSTLLKHLLPKRKYPRETHIYILKFFAKNDAPPSRYG